jgi:hypothetical protein
MEPKQSSVWHPLTRFAFRFVFLYVILFSFAFTVPLILEVIPGGESLTRPYESFLGQIISWVGKHVLQLDREIPTDPSGSGDRTFHYVQLLCYLALALVGMVVWTLLDRRRPNYEQLHRWLRAYVRLSLGIIMITYGAGKVIKAQFPSPSLDRLTQPFGEASPMGLLWTFMGFSQGYNIFTGAGEMLGGVLLFSRRTTTLGALISIGVLGHIVVLNFCYDVPVKLLSSHLLAMAVFLLVPDARRLADFFLFNRSAAPADLSPLFGRKWLDRSAIVMRTLLLLIFLGLTLHWAYDLRQKYGDGSPRSPLYGLWNVEEFEQDGQVRPPLLTDKDRWRRVIFDKPRMVAIQRMNNSRERFLLQLDSEQKTLALSRFADPKRKHILSFDQAETDVLTLTGELDGRHIRAKARRSEGAEFLLLNRGFHWISEQPFNR